MLRILHLFVRILQNCKLKFVNVEFWDTLITDLSPEPGVYGEISAFFVDTNFTGSKCDIEECGVILKDNNDQDWCSDQGIIPMAHLMEQYTFRKWYSGWNFNIFVSTVANVTIKDHNPTKHHNSTLSAKSREIKLQVLNTTLENNYGGIDLQKQDSGLLDSWLQVYLQNCYFINNSKTGSAGAVHVSLFLSHSDDLHCSIQIFNSKFVDNYVERADFSRSFGGALAVQSFQTIQNAFQRKVSIFSCIFQDNKADDGGGVIYNSENSIPR